MIAQATIQQVRPPAQAPSPARPATPDPLDLLEQFGGTVTIQRDHEIYAQGDTAAFCWRVVRGCVRTVRLMEDGRRAVGEFLMAGDCFGFDDLGTHDLAAEAVTDVTLRRYPRRMVESLAAGHPGLAQRLRTMALASLRGAHEQALLLARKTAVERIATFLLGLYGRPARATLSVDLPMSRTDIADHLGLTVETVCRTLACLKREGVLSVERTGVTLHDLPALRALAGGTRH